MAKKIKPGDRVRVLDENGKPVFTGHLAPTSPPWWGWSRVVPDGHIDLPPKYTLEKIGESE